MLAKRISLSEPSVKRILSRGSLSLPRLERICEAAGLSMEELTRPAPSAHSENSSTLSAAQEMALAADRQLLGCFYLLTNGHTPREVAAELGADEKLLRRWLVKLDNLHLVELRARLGARLRVHAPISGVKMARSAAPTSNRCAKSSCVRDSRRRTKRCISVRPSCPRLRARFYSESSRGSPPISTSSRISTVMCQGAKNAAWR